MQVYRTANQEGRSKLAYWQDLIERSYASCDGLTDRDENFDASLAVAPADGCEFTDVRSSAIRYVRSAWHVRIGQRDDLFVALMLKGYARFRQNEHAVIHPCGDILIFDTARPYEFDYPEGHSSVLLRVPRPMLDSRLHGSLDLGGTVISGTNPYGRLIGSTLQSLTEIANNGDLPPGFVTPALDLIAHSIAQTVGADLPLSRASRSALHRVKRYIAENLGDEDLSLEKIAADQNMSVRTLSRIFAQDETTPIAWLQKQRLAKAYSLLTEKRCRSVTDAAFDCGFKDLSHFGRSFKRSFGITPRQAFGETTE
jgi:AraC-like DNA-binding protein